MEKHTQKKVAVINDLSGYGRCSLTVAIPILSAMRIQCCPVPTAILSNHTGFPVWFFDDYTDKMISYTDKWRELGLSFDGIVTGFLGSLEQIEIVRGLLPSLSTDDTKLVVDPVMGDHGVLYPTYTEEMCEEIKALVSVADLVTPNVTEACILTGTPYKETGFSRKELLNLAVMLRLMGAKSVIITGAREGVYYTNVVLERGQNEAEFVKMKSAGEGRPGTGDVFCSVAAGAYLSGKTPLQAAEQAARFVRDCIARSEELEIPIENGVCFEELLGKLIKSNP
ncbi:pyridoxamine kinase [bacterium 1XD42-94]|nr:pyridoxamine kinase [bacterium 1XD42-76]NBK03802.1 pyridoxamine kinase [bacterium 1XD42-94]